MNHSINIHIRTVLLAVCMLLLPSMMRAEKEAWVEFSDGTLTFHYDENRTSSSSANTYSLPARGEDPGWLTQKDAVEHVVFDKSFADARPKTCAKWFLEQNNLADITGIEYLNTDSVNDMSRMFKGCYKLTSLDLRHFNTENVTTMTEMFCACWGLTELDASSFNTSKVDDMSFLFQTCEKLEKVDISSFDTHNVTNMERMFGWCNALSTIYASSGFVTDKVKNSQEMFQYCYKLPNFKSEKITIYAVPTYMTFLETKPWVEYESSTKTLTFHNDGKTAYTTYDVKYDLPEGGADPEWLKTDIEHVVIDWRFADVCPKSCKKWFYGLKKLTDIKGLKYLDTSEVDDMTSMFQNCESLASIDVSHFNTENVTLMTSMFQECLVLTELDVTSFNVLKVTDMSFMFEYCEKLTTLDLTSFDTWNVSQIYDLFHGCSSLNKIYVSSKFVLNSVTDTQNHANMFMECTSMPNFNADKVDGTYAHYKEGGYFTLRRHFSVGDAKYTVDGYEAPVCYSDVDFTDGSAYSSDFDFAFSSGNKASYTRTVKNHWATLCLPFAFSADGADASFYGVENYTDSKLNVKKLTGTIAAGTPVLAYVTDGELSVSALGAAVVATPASDTVLKGVFTQTAVANDDYIVANDYFWNAGWLKDNNTDAQYVYAAPYRASLALNLSAGAKPTSIGIAEDETDGIKSVDTTDNTDDFLNGAELYDLQGRRLSTPVNGMMIVRKGGVSHKVVVR